MEFRRLLLLLQVGLFGGWGCGPTAVDTAIPGELDPASCGEPGGTRFEVAGWGPAWAQQVAGTEEQIAGWGASVADFDGDGRLDVFLPQYGQDALYLQTADGTMVDASAALPVENERGIGSAAGDFDGDGDFDLVVVAAGAGGSLLLNKLGAFHDVTETAGIPRWQLQGYSAAWGDMEGDGDLDLVVGRLGGEFVAEGAEPPACYNGLFENVGAGVFVDRCDRLIGDAQAEFTFLASWLDAEGDGDQDLFFVNDKGHVGLGNALLINDGTGHYTDITAESGLGVSMTGAMGLGIGDLNDDRLPDLLVTDWGRLWMFESAAPHVWFDAAQSLGIVNDVEADQLVAWGAELEDLDADGRLDAVVAYGTDEIITVDGPPHGGTIPPDREPLSILHRGADGRFTEVAPAWGTFPPEVDRGVVVADLDGDGLLDLLRRDVWGVATADVQTGGGGGWLQVDLQQDGPNVWGIGAQVEIEVEGARQTRWVRAGGTSLSSSGPPMAHFGVGDHLVVDRVVVNWPDGGVTEAWGVAACQRLQITR